MKKTFTADLALTFIKAAILTIIVVGVIASLSSCGDSMSAGRKVTNQFRARALKTGRVFTVTNRDSLAVLVGDTVTVFFSENENNYYISNNPVTACDTTTTEMYVDSKDTIYSRFEAWNVVLLSRVVK